MKPPPEIQQAVGEPPVQHNEAANRYEIDLHGQLAVAEYERTADRIVLTHTFVPLEWRVAGETLHPSSSKVLPALSPEKRTEIK